MMKSSAWKILYLISIASLHQEAYSFQDYSYHIFRNATMVEGREGEIPCSYGRLHMEVNWIRNTDRAMLASGTQLIINDRRFRNRNPPWDEEWWQLGINPVQKSDEGFYTCQVKDHPETKKVTYLTVIADDPDNRWWRPDYRCGITDFLEGSLSQYRAECDPQGVYPCCSPGGWCGIGYWHCRCDGCIDYRT